MDSESIPGTLGVGWEYHLGGMPGPHAYTCLNNCLHQGQFSIASLSTGMFVWVFFFGRKPKKLGEPIWTHKKIHMESNPILVLNQALWGFESVYHYDMPSTEF